MYAYFKASLGITSLRPKDRAMAEQKGCEARLTPTSLELGAHPSFTRKTNL